MGNFLDPVRFVLEGVPRVAFGVVEERRDVEDTTFPSSLSAALEFMGEEVGWTPVPFREEMWRDNQLYVYLMGTSGCAFRLSWREGWHEDNVEIMYMSDDPEAPFRRAFQAVGYDFTFVNPEPGRDNRAIYLQAIWQSLVEKGRPVLAFGIIGPPECGLVTGYDEGGNVLIGWNFFQTMPEFNAGVEFEPNGMYRKRDWFRPDDSLILIGDKIGRPLQPEAYIEALRWGVQIARTTQTTTYGGPRHTGQAAYDAWARHLLLESAFPADDPVQLAQHFWVHSDTVGIVAEERWYAHQFVQQAKTYLPAVAEELQAAASCYEAQHDLMWKIWAITGGPDRNPEYAHTMVDIENRRRIAAFVLEAKAQDAEATQHLEAALAMLAVPV
jgi:hypothetical protein